MKLTGRLIQRFITFLFFLLAFAASSWSQVPSEAAGFAGGGLHLYPMGWSSEGRWGALIASTAPQSDGIRLLVLDAVTDEVLYRSTLMEWDGPEAVSVFWERYGRSIREKTDSFNLESTMRPDVRDAGFITGGIEYGFVMNPASPARGAYTLKIESSRGDSKDVYSSPSTRIPERSILLGSLVSPFESRALAIIREIPAYGEGEPSYRFSGAHLTQGFATPSTQPAWTATQPSSTGSLVSAVYNGQEYLVRARLAAGVDPESRDSRGYTSLLVAARLGHWKIATDLLAAGASPNAVDVDARSALHYAAFAGNLAVVQILLDAGAEKGLRDKAGLMAADLAAEISLRNLLQ